MDTILKHDIGIWLHEIMLQSLRASDFGLPTIILEGDANGAPHPDATYYEKKFPGKYAHRIVTGGRTPMLMVIDCAEIKKEI